MSETAEGGAMRRGRDETEEERADRMWGELIQEVSVAQTGVQILFGFLLTVVFTSKYDDLADTDQAIYIVTVVLGACATGALIGPVSAAPPGAGAARQGAGGRLGLPADLRRPGAAARTTMTSALLLVLRVATHDDYVP